MQKAAPVYIGAAFIAAFKNTNEKRCGSTSKKKKNTKFIWQNPDQTGKAICRDFQKYMSSFAKAPELLTFFNGQV